MTPRLPLKYVQGPAGKRHDPNKQRLGFTLVEILVVVAVFSVVMLVATNIFLITTKSSRRTALSQKLQGDIRFAVEAIAREVRYGTIDYDCYNQPNESCDPHTPTIEINLQNLFGRTSLLALRDVNGNRVRYKVITISGVPKLMVCLISIADEPLDKCDIPPPDPLSAWEVVTPEDVEIVKGEFYLYPFQNPFRLKDPVPASGSPFESDAQPRVTIVLKTKQSTTESLPENISAQTTVVSRLYAR